jgi:hypothetical protein
MRTEIEL